MYEHHTEPVISRHDFLWRMAHHVGMVMPLIGLSLGIGVLGYHFIAGLGWIDALLNASMIASGMGPVGDVPSTPGKVFASLYALYSGLFLIAITGWLISPLLHRLMHKFHAHKKAALLHRQHDHPVPPQPLDQLRPESCGDIVEVHAV